MEIYTLVQGDTAPQIKATVTREDDGSVVSFAGGSVITYASGGKETIFEILNFNLRADFND